MTKKRELSDAVMDRVGIERLLPPSWDAFVESHKYGSIYHSSRWIRTLQQAYGYRSLYVTLKDVDGTIEAGLPVTIISTPFRRPRFSSLPLAQACNPLVDTDEQLLRLIGAIEGSGKAGKRKLLELKTTASFKPEIPARVVRQFCTHILDIKRSDADIFSAFHKNCIQRKIKKAEGGTIKLWVGQSIKDLRIFYSLYLGMRKDIGLLPQPYRFFQALWDEFSPVNQCEVCHAVYEEKVVASVLLLKFKETVTYEYGASDDIPSPISPSIFLLWESIKRAKASGFRFFDFGRTDLNNSGLMEFKGRWGATKEDLLYYYFPENDPLKHLRYAKWSKGFMNIVIRNSPKLLCRILGRAIYKKIA